MNSSDSEQSAEARPVGRCFANGVVLWTLRVVILLQCLGVGGRYLFSSSETESDVYGLLFFDRDWPEEVAQRIDDGGAWACLLAVGLAISCAALADVRGAKTKPDAARDLPGKLCRLGEVFGLAVIALWMLALAETHSVRGEPYAQWTLGEHAVRILGPIALILLGGCRWDCAVCWRRSAGTVLLFIASASTFIAHGYKAIELYGPFLDLILLTDLRWTQFGLEQVTAEQTLWTIGIIDIIVAALLLLTRWRWLALYMAAWGVIVSLSRMTAFGTEAWPETLLRTANGGVPLVLWLMCRQTINSDAKSAA